MADFILSCCSTTDLTPAQYRDNDLHYISFHFQLDGKEYLDNYGVSMPMKTFFDAMAAGARTATSQVSTGEFVAYFRSFLQDGKDILHLSLSSGLSGCYHSACAARELLLEEFPERTICVIDSLCGSGGAAILMLEAAKRRDRGDSLGEIAAWIEEKKLYVHHWLFTPELIYFVRGGRVSRRPVGSVPCCGCAPWWKPTARGGWCPGKKSAASSGPSRPSWVKCGPWHRTARTMTAPVMSPTQII